MAQVVQADLVDGVVHQVLVAKLDLAEPLGLVVFQVLLGLVDFQELLERVDFQELLVHLALLV